MVAIEIGVAVVVLMGAGLLYRSVSRLGLLDLGFNPEHLVAVKLGLPPQVAGGTRADVYQFYSRAIDAVSTVPLVQSVAGVSGRPLKGPIGLDSAWQVEGQSLEVAERNPWVNLDSSRLSNFATIGTPLIEGRPFPMITIGRQQNQSSSSTRNWPDGPGPGNRRSASDSGRRASMSAVRRSHGGRSSALSLTSAIASSVRSRSRSVFYGAFQQSWFSVGDLVIRTSAPPATVVPAIRARLRQISPDDIIDIALMERVVDAHESPWKTNLLLFAVFAGLTVLLAVVGLYATLAFAVSDCHANRHPAGTRGKQRNHRAQCPDRWNAHRDSWRVRGNPGVRARQPIHCRYAL